MLWGYRMAASVVSLATGRSVDSLGASHLAEYSEERRITIGQTLPTKRNCSHEHWSRMDAARTVEVDGRMQAKPPSIIVSDPPRKTERPPERFSRASAVNVLFLVFDFVCRALLIAVRDQHEIDQDLTCRSYSLRST